LLEFSAVPRHLIVSLIAVCDSSFQETSSPSCSSSPHCKPLPSFCWLSCQITLKSRGRISPLLFVLNRFQL
jgi:hypothetical protein